MHINKITITDIGGINELSLSFNRKMNIICGPNGIGKTTILECVAYSCSSDSSEILKRRANCPSGKIVASIHRTAQQADYVRTIDVNIFEPEKLVSTYLAENDIIKNLLSLKVARTFIYQSLGSVSRDADRSTHICSSGNTKGVPINDVKNWFVNRYLYSAHPNALTPAQISNFEHSKKFFSMLNPDFQFSHVDASSNEIIVNTPAGQIIYEYLSSGFKSTLSILFGVTKELEFRFKNEGTQIEEFEGVILIDELELHLHPEWQARMVEVLKKAFPCAQFIVSTHSPHIIQTAQPDEIISLVQDGNVVKQKQVASGKYGFQGWTVEEILFDVMGMEDTRTAIYHQAMAKFQNAVTEDNYEMGEIAFRQLEEMLHHQNHLRKLLAFQLGALKG
ncbi:hypothetical protein YKD1_07710 [Yersinia pseudotuberculosis]|uniref:AAA family ATPase n=1 Tax=Yersinia pseudotuberculosis TaxID=633 RepID=UPI0038B5ED17